jgi:putative transposase
MLRKTFPVWQTVYQHVRKWSRDVIWGWLDDRLRAQVGKAVGKDRRLTSAALDSQTPRSESHGGDVGCDAPQKTKGRKRFVLVDALGWQVLGEVKIDSTPERAGAQEFAQLLLPQLSWLQQLWVDGDYSRPEFAGWVQEDRPQLEVKVIPRAGQAQGLEVLVKWWVLECALA